MDTHLFVLNLKKVIEVSSPLKISPQSINLVFSIDQESFKDSGFIVTIITLNLNYVEVPLLFMAAFLFFLSFALGGSFSLPPLGKFDNGLLGQFSLASEGPSHIWSYNSRHPFP